MVMEKLKRVRALVTDVDGVMTDGSITVQGEHETKSFSVRDGLGIKILQRSGLDFALLSGRESIPLRIRAEELGIKVIKTGRLDKQTAFNEIENELGIAASDMVYIGDDIPDLAPLQMAAVGFCPMDAAEEVRAAVDEIVPLPGGKGVVRYVVERILKAQDLWERVVMSFEVRP